MKNRTRPRLGAPVRENLVSSSSTPCSVDSIVPRRTPSDLCQLPSEILNRFSIFQQKMLLNRLERSFLAFKLSGNAMRGAQLG